MRSILRRISITTAVMLAAAGLAPQAEAAIMQIGTFGQEDTLNYSYSGGNLTGSTTGTFSFDPAFGLAAGTFTDATLTISATATGNVLVAGPIATQEMQGSIVVEDDMGNVLLSTTFTDAFLTGFINGNTVSLSGDTSVAGTIVYASDVFNAALLTDPSAFTFDLNPISPQLTVSGNNFTDFTGRDTANFSASVVTPEPASLALFGLGLTTVGAIARRRRRR